MASVNLNNVAQIQGKICNQSVQHRLQWSNLPKIHPKNCKRYSPALKLFATSDETQKLKTLTSPSTNSTSISSFSENTQVPNKNFKDLQTGPQVVEYLKQKFTRDSKFEVAQALQEMEKMVVPLFFKKVLGKRWIGKTRYAYEEMMGFVEEQIEELSPSELVVVVKSIGKTSKVSVSKKEPNKVAPMFLKLIAKIFDKLDDLSDEEICAIAMSVQNFKQSNSEDYPKIFKQIESRFFNAAPQLQALFFRSLTQLRYCSPEFQQRIENAILSRTIIFESEFQVRLCIHFFAAFGVLNQQILEVLFQQYLNQADEYKSGCARAITAMSHAGAPIQFIQKMIDHALRPLNEEKLEIFIKKAPVQWKRRLELLYLNSEQKLEFPQNLPNREIPQKNRRKKIVNPGSDEVFEFLSAKLEAAVELERWVVIEDGFQRLELQIVSKNNKDVKIDVETRYFTSYTVSEPKKLLGNVKAIFQTIENSGWSVVVVDGMRFTNDQAYQQQILADVQEILNDGKISKEPEWKL